MSKWNDPCDNVLSPNGTLAVVSVNVSPSGCNFQSMLCSRRHLSMASFFFWDEDNDFLLIC